MFKLLSKPVASVILVLLLLLLSKEALAQKPNEETIYHPSAQEDGLERIDSEGNYIYNTDEPLRNQSFNLRLGMVHNPDIGVMITSITDGTENFIHFDDMYDGAEKLSIGLDYEYFFTTEGGKLGVQGGLAFQFAQGHGRLASDPTQESVEKFTFITMPLFLGLTYRFEYKDRQLLAPYISGGGTYVALVETRDDRSKPNFTGNFGFYGAGGCLFNITALDRDLSGEMRSEYGIANLWVSAEFRSVYVDSEAFSYINNFIQAGVTVDY